MSLETSNVDTVDSLISSSINVTSKFEIADTSDMDADVVTVEGERRRRSFKYLECNLTGLVFTSCLGSFRFRVVWLIVVKLGHDRLSRFSSSFSSRLFFFFFFILLTAQRPDDAHAVDDSDEYSSLTDGDDEVGSDDEDDDSNEGDDPTKSNSYSVTFAVPVRDDMDKSSKAVVANEVVAV